MQEKIFLAEEGLLPPTPNYISIILVYRVKEGVREQRCKYSWNVPISLCFLIFSKLKTQHTVQNVSTRSNIFQIN